MTRLRRLARNWAHDAFRVLLIVVGLVALVALLALMVRLGGGAVPG